MNPSCELLDPLVLRGVLLYGERKADMLLAGGVIRGLASSLDASGAIDIDADGLVALPGLVDLHTHLREPAPDPAETVESGSRAAAAGGYVAVFAMANTDPVADCPSVVEQVVDAADRLGWCDVYPVGAVTRGLAGRELAELSSMAASRAQVRMFSDDGRCVEDDMLCRQALLELGAMSCILAQHAQCTSLVRGGQVNEGMVATRLGLEPWPRLGETRIIERDLALLEQTASVGARLHVCHVSTARSAELIREAKGHGLPVTAEVTPHHLALVDLACLSGDTNFKVNPPLRSVNDVLALRQALVDGTIDAIATDHAPHRAELKATAWPLAPFGMLGLETALPVVVEQLVVPGKMSWRQIAHVMAERPAEIGGIADRHGRPLAVGEPATLCLVDPGCHWSVEPGGFESMSGNSPYLGEPLSARVVATINRGKKTFDREAMLTEATRR